jgi:hypothetical protein
VKAQLRVAAVVGLLMPSLGCCMPGPSPSTVPLPPVPAATPGPTPQPIDVRCIPESGPMQSALAGDPCPGAITAVELAVAQVRLPIDRVVIEPGPFFCDVIWPTAGAPPACYGVLVVPGQFMHAWVGFQRSSEIAAVMLGRDLPRDLSSPAAVPLPWAATLVRVEVPPAGWVMP